MISGRREVLADELVGEAATAYLVLGRLGILCPHVAAQIWRDIVLLEAGDFLDVILAIEQIGINPMLTLVRKPKVLLRRGGIANRAGHRGTGSQSAEVIDSA